MGDDLVKRLRASWSMEAVESDNPYLSELAVDNKPADICLEAADKLEAYEQAIEEAKKDPNLKFFDQFEKNAWYDAIAFVEDFVERR